MRRWKPAIDRALDDFVRAEGSAERSIAVGRLLNLRTHGPNRPARRLLDRTFARVREIMLTDSREQVRLDAAYILTFWKERRAPRLLLKVLGRRDEAASIRAQAAEGVGWGLQGARARSAELRDAALAVLSETLSDSSPDVRFWSVYAAGQLKATDLRHALQTIAEADHETCAGWWRVSEEAKDALEYLETGSWPERSPAR